MSQQIFKMSCASKAHRDDCAAGQ